VAIRAEFRTSAPVSTRLPINAPAVIPTLKAVEMPADARSVPPGATRSTSEPSAVGNPDSARPAVATAATAIAGTPLHRYWAAKARI